MIEVEALTKRYGAFTAVEDLGFTVADGEILGLLGPNGAGKTTTMRMLTGFFPPSSGTARVAGHDVVEAPMRAKAAVGYLPESPPLYPEMTVADYVDFVARIKGVPRRHRRARVDEALRRCAVDDLRDQLTGKLSKGYRQRVGLAQALVHDPSVLVLDEPTAGLDPKQIGETRELIRSLGGDHTVILSTHILPEVAMTCDRVVIVHGGKLAAHGTPESLHEQFRAAHRLELTVEGPADRIAEVLGGVDGVVGFTEKRLDGPEGPGRSSLDIEVREGLDLRSRLAEAIVRGGLGLLELRQTGTSLEDVYLRAISREERR